MLFRSGVRGELSRARAEASARKGGRDELLALAQERIALLEKQVEDARAKPAAGRLRCPRCHDPMIEYEHDVVRADRCGGCGGIFFDKGELEAVIDAHDRSREAPLAEGAEGQQAGSAEGTRDSRGLLGLMRAMLGRR